MTANEELRKLLGCGRFEPSGCYEWQLSTSSNGYGKYFSQVQKRYVATHRRLWELIKGEIPEGLYVCHTCDNKRCVNIDHLFLGTPKDNITDMVNKNKQPKGETHGMSKLNKDLVIEILYHLAAKWRICDIASKYKINWNCIHDIRTQRTWKHVSNSAL